MHVLFEEKENQNYCIKNWLGINLVFELKMPVIQR